MVELVNKVTGTPMWVAEDRVQNYLAAGHKLAAEPAPEKKPTEKKLSPKKKK